MSDLDELMSRDPTQLTNDDIEEIIKYQRQQRAARETGVRTSRSRPKPPTEKIDLTGLASAPSIPIIKRR